MQHFSKETYALWADEHAKGRHHVRNILAAFFVGGGICLLGEGMRVLYLSFGLSEQNAALAVTVSLVFLSALLTALGVFDRIARFAGAGTLVPVTGFANAVVSPAMDHKSEGPVLGVGAKIFTVAGPVILFGVLSGALYGLIYALFLAFGGAA